MIYAAEDFVSIGRRDTPGWITLPPLARFVSLELARYLDANGEISVGRQGLRALAALLHAEWSEIEQAVALLLTDGRLEHDEARRVVRDPQHRARQEAARGATLSAPLHLSRPAHEATMARRAAAPRPLSMTPNAIRKRARRAALAEAAAAQLELPAVEAAAVAMAAAGPVATLEGADRRGDLVSPCVATAAARPSASLSVSSDDLKKSESRPRTPRATAAAVELDPEVLPPAFRELAGKVRPDLSDLEGVLARSWRRFARSHGGRHKSPRVVEARWESWIERERADASPSGATPAPAPAEPSTGRLRPPRDTSARLIRERETWEREAPAPELAAQYAARALAALDLGDRARALEALVEQENARAVA